MASDIHLAVTPSPRQSCKWMIMALIGLCALLAHCRSINYPFVSLDDHYVVTLNMVVLKGLTLEGLKYAFTDVGSDLNWIPVTRLSHMLDVQLYGEAAWGHHLTNILLHAANAMLLWLLLNTLTRSVWRSAVAAVLFAVHPIHVESIAWISERRDVLSLFMGLLGLIAYAHYGQSSRRTHAIAWYVFAMLGCSLSMMAKPTMVTLPCVMFLLDFWPLQRLQVAWRSEKCKTAIAWLVMEKLPLFGMTLVSAYFTMAGQLTGVSSALSRPLSQRLVRLPLMYMDYLVMWCWPVNISPLYANHFDWTISRVIVCIVALLLISYVVVRLYKRQPFLLTGWLWYLGTLVPMSGLVAIGFHTHASRFVYYPFIGIYIIIAWLGGLGYAALSSRLPSLLCER